jgi:uncharacterized protein YggU (UPF0235/DUF167 family)
MAETTIVVAVKPGSKRAAIDADAEGITVRVMARAIEGAANEAVQRALARALGVAPSAVTLVRGARARTKTFAIAGLSDAELARWRATLGGRGSSRNG